MAVYCYLRVSTDEQANSGLGLEAQRAACEAAAARLGAPLARVFTDAGVSGKTPLDKRPALVAALGAVKRGDVLVVAKRDRLARDVFIALVVERQLAARKARLVSAAGEGSDSDGPTDMLLRRLLDAFSEFERALISSRTKAAAKAKQARGERWGQVPFGYTLAGDGKRLVPHAAEQAVLARLAALRAAGLSVRGVCRQLEAEGHCTRRGRRWNPGHVHGLLTQLAARGPVAVAA